MARVYADVNQRMPKSYWDYDSVNVSWGVVENYEVVRKIGMKTLHVHVLLSCCSSAACFCVLLLVCNLGLEY